MKQTSMDNLKMHLFDVIERLKDSNDPKTDITDKIDIPTAKAISDVAQTIINAAKVEVDALKILAYADNPEATKNAIGKFGLLEIGE